MKSFKPFHYFLFGTSALLLAQYSKNLYVSIGFYFVSLILYILALIGFRKEKK